MTHWADNQSRLCPHPERLSRFNIWIGLLILRVNGVPPGHLGKHHLKLLPIPWSKGQPATNQSVPGNANCKHYPLCAAFVWSFVGHKDFFQHTVPTYIQYLKQPRPQMKKQVPWEAALFTTPVVALLVWPFTEHLPCARSSSWFFAWYALPGELTFTHHADARGCAEFHLLYLILSSGGPCEMNIIITSTAGNWGLERLHGMSKGTQLWRLQAQNELDLFHSAGLNRTTVRT